MQTRIFSTGVFALLLAALPLAMIACGGSLPTPTASNGAAPSATSSAGSSAASPTATPAATATPTPPAAATMQATPAGTAAASATPPNPSNAASPTATPAAPREVAVTIEDFKFAPATVTIALGTTVVWTNVGPTEHTTTSKQGLWDSGILPKEAVYRFTFSKPGEYPYWCSLHPDMLGTIIVK